MKKSIIIILILLAIIGCAGIIYATGNFDKVVDKVFLREENEEDAEKEKEDINFSQVAEMCEKITDEEIKFYCINAICNSVKKKDENTETMIKKCMEKENISERDTCLSSIAPTEEICDNMSDTTGNYNSPKSHCYLALDKEKSNVSLCEKINDSIGTRTTCYKSIAKNKKDPGICQKINYDYFKNWCLENPDENLCVYDLKWHEESTFVYEFEDNMNYCLAVAKEDISKCDNINETFLKYYCYKDIAEQKNDLSICDKIEWEGVYREDCYVKIAVLREDASLCDKLGENYRNLCYERLAVKKRDSSLCKEISSNKEQGQCYFHIALSMLSDSNIYLDEEPALCKDFDSLITGEEIEGDEEITESAQKSARDAKRKSDLSQIILALEMYNSDFDKYPASKGLEKIQDKNCVLRESLKSIISNLPLDPKDPEYWYGYKSDGKTYELTARLENLEDENCITQNGVCLYKCKDGKCGIKE